MKQDNNLILTAVVVLLVFVCGPATTRIAAQNGGPPEEFEDSFPIDGICEFPVFVELSGKTKTIVLPGDRLLFTFPGEVVTLTNLETLKQETLGITGANRLRELENGDIELVLTGRNLIIGFDEVNAFVITVGRFSVAFNPETFEITQPLSGSGSVINVCELLN